MEINRAIHLFNKAIQSIDKILEKEDQILEDLQCYGGSK